jgi:hypothetical protein
MFRAVTGGIIFVGPKHMVFYETLTAGQLFTIIKLVSRVLQSLAACACSIHVYPRKNPARLYKQKESLPHPQSLSTESPN